MKIRVKKEEFFEKWLEWLNPILPLKEIDRKVLGALITLHYIHKDRYSPDVIQELLMSDSTKEIISKRLGLSINQINKSFKNFRDSGIITEDNKLHKSLINYPSNNKFKITVEFEVYEESTSTK